MFTKNGRKKTVFADLSHNSMGGWIVGSEWVFAAILKCLTVAIWIRLSQYLHYPSTPCPLESKLDLILKLLEVYSVGSKMSKKYSSWLIDWLSSFRFQRWTSCSKARKARASTFKLWAQSSDSSRMRFKPKACNQAWNFIISSILIAIYINIFLIFKQKCHYM